jgi:hypothetical protein
MGLGLWLRDLFEIVEKFRSDSGEFFRPLTELEISCLVRSGNSSADWSRLFVPTNDDPTAEFYFENIRNCRFEGTAVLVGFTRSSKISLGKGISLSSGLFNSTFAGTCFLGKDCTVRDTHCVNDTFIAHQAAVVGCGVISFLHNNKSLYGNDALISVGPSTGGRFLNLHVLEPFSHLAYKSLSSLSPAHSAFSVVEVSVERLQFNQLIASLSLTVIGSHAIVSQCDEITNCLIGSFSQVTRTRALSDCTLHSSRFHPIVVDRASELRRVVMMQHTTAGDECRVRDVQMFEHSSISGGALVEVCLPLLSHSLASSHSLSSLSLAPITGMHLGSRLKCRWRRVSALCRRPSYRLPPQLSPHLFCVALRSR